MGNPERNRQGQEKKSSKDGWTDSIEENEDRTTMQGF